VLSDEKGETWWDTSVSENIRKRAESRKSQEDKIRWHTSRGQSLIYYTELGDLVSILQNNWELFEDYLHSFEWAKNIIVTLEKSRNVIMHGGQLDMTDIERIGTSIRDWVRQIGS
jgi:predicted oxidoreductase (fatty acid repression mutant protein)